MKSTLPVRLTPQADRDLETIGRYIAEDNRIAARKFVASIRERFPMLGRFPEMGTRCGHILIGLRQLPVGEYNIYYKILEDRIEIVRVLHGARDVDAVFGEGYEDMQ